MMLMTRIESLSKIPNNDYYQFHNVTSNLIDTTTNSSKCIIIQYWALSIRILPICACRNLHL